MLALNKNGSKTTNCHPTGDMVYKDGMKAMIETMMNSHISVTLVCIEPVPNIVAVLEREPRISRKARVVGMHGCLRKTPWEYNGKVGGLVAEYNVRRREGFTKGF